MPNQQAAEKAHLLEPVLRTGTARAGNPSKMGAAPCIWTLLSSLGRNEFLGTLLGQAASFCPIR
jgi:hypothetical protein